MATLYIIRGLPGSGKSTYARNMMINRWIDFHFEADDYWIRPDGSYDFNPKKIKDAHAWCKNQVESVMITDTAHGSQNPDCSIAVANTFVRRWEFQPYIDLTEKYGYDVETIICEGEFENIHGVPKDIIEKKRQEFEV